MKQHVQSGHRNWLIAGWTTAFLAAGAGALFFTAPGGPGTGFFFDAVGLLTGVTILIGVVVHRPAERLGWYCLVVGLSLVTAGNLLLTLAAIQQQPVESPGLAHLLLVAGYPAFITGVARLLPTRDRSIMSLLDTVIVVVSGAVVVWVFLMAPYVSNSSLTLAEKALSLINPVMDFTLLAMIARGLLMNGSAARNLSRSLFLCTAMLVFTSDLIYGIQTLEGTYLRKGIADAILVMGFALLAIAAIHPSMAKTSPVEPRSVHRTGRLWALGLALLLMPVVMSVLLISSRPLHLPVMIAGSSVLIALVLARMGLLMKELGAQVDEVETRRAQLADAFAEREVMTQELFHNSTHDALTGLAGRVLFYQRAQQAMSIHDVTSALLFIDLDDFKSVNDNLGHQAGDEILLQVAERLRRELRFGDTVGRLGGDEFAVVLQHVSCERARQVADRIIQSLRMPFELQTEIVAIGASIGGAIGGGGTEVDDLVSAADAAMYLAKDWGKNTCVFVGDQRAALADA